MKYLKMLGLAAVGAAALTAFGAGTAAATTLCTTTTTPCTATINEVDMSMVGSAIFKSTSGVTLDTCTGGTTKLQVEADGVENTARGKIQTLTWSGCTRTTDTLKNGELEIHHIAGTDNGTVTARGSEWTTNTIFGSCVYGYGTGHDLGTLTGGHTPTLKINMVLTRISGPCPESGTWEAQYHITNHTTVYVESS